MPLHVAIQMDPIEKLDIIGDTSFALGLEAQARGHDLTEQCSSSCLSSQKSEVAHQLDLLS